MLTFHRIARPEDKRGLFDQFKPAEKNWVVSDLQSKWHLQKELLHRHKILQDGTVLRATELWKKLAFQLYPDIHFLSRELAQTVFWDWIEPMKVEWAKSPQAVPVLLTQMETWMSIFADPSHEDLMNEWFTDNPESFVRWGHWFKLGSAVWNRCREEGLVMESWLPSLILGGEVGRLKLAQPLVFDLGPQVSAVEGQLIRELAKLTDIEVIVPEVPWIHLMKNALKPYEDLLEERFQGEPDWQPEVSSQVEFGRFSTQLAEVKDAVSRARRWIEDGVAPQKIAFIAPDIEEYWPALRLYLREEGIPACKPVTARLSGFVETAQWMAGLRTSISKVSSPDLEVFFYSDQEKPRLPFDEFRILFSHVYDSLDMGRARELFESMGQAPAREPQPVEEFLLWALSSWSPNADQTRLLSLLQVLGREVPRGLRLLPHQWLGYLEGLLARREIPIQPANENGVWCVSLSSADWLEVTHGIFLNLSEGALRRVETSPVSASEAQKIQNDTGYALGTMDRQELEFESLWFLQRRWEELRLCFAASDFQGGVMTPSKLWMWAGFTNGKLKKDPEAPGLTRWDEIQHLDFGRLTRERGLPDEQVQALDLGLRRDLTGEVSTWKPSKEERLSASSLEKYRECPFIFAAQRKLKLSDDPAMDLDLDRMTRGRLLHGVLEQLLGEPLNLKLTDEALSRLVDEVREKEEVRLGDDRLWPAIRSQHVRLAKLFIDFEKEWRARFPETKTVGRETSFECYWDAETGQPTCEPTPIKMTGRLDRVDAGSDGRYALIDYKASKSGLTNWKSWMDNGSFQMALYALLLESGLAGLAKGEVALANYFVVRDRDRRRGFHLKGADGSLYSAEDNFRNFIDSGEKSALFEATRGAIQEVVKEILEGRLNPQPVETKICTGCSWRTLCRAPHLN